MENKGREKMKIYFNKTIKQEKEKKLKLFVCNLVQVGKFPTTGRPCSLWSRKPNWDKTYLEKIH